MWRGIGGYSGGLLRAERDIGWGSDMWQWDSLAVRTFPVVLEGKKEKRRREGGFFSADWGVLEREHVSRLGEFERE